MLRTRLLSAAILIPIVVGVALAGEPWLTLVVGVVGFLAMIELIALLDAAGLAPPQVIGLGAGLLVSAASLTTINRTHIGGSVADLLHGSDPIGLTVPALVVAAILLAVVAFTRSDPRQGFLTWSSTLFGVAYLGLLAPFIAATGHLGPPDGSASTAVGAFGLHAGIAWSLLLLLVVWGYDSGAFAVGRWLGRRRLIDHVSPSKTVEGLVGGLLVATAAAGIGAMLVGLDAWQPLVLGPLIGGAAQAGDLAESLIKRAAGRKESGFLVPGHGGVLDRIDSFLFAAPVLVGYALLVAGYHL